MTNKQKSGASLGFENKLREMADKMCGHMDSGEYKHAALGLIFLKYISDAFKAKYDALKATVETDYTDPKTRMNMRPPISSGCRRMHVGRKFRTKPNSRPSARSSTMR